MGPSPELVARATPALFKSKCEQELGGEKAGKLFSNFRGVRRKSAVFVRLLAFVEEWNSCSAVHSSILEEGGFPHLEILRNIGTKNTINPREC